MLRSSAIALLTGAMLLVPTLAIAKDAKAPASVTNEKLWSDGAKRVSKGEDMIKDADKDTRKAEGKKRKGEDKIASGKARTQAAQDAYKSTLTGLTPPSDPKAAFGQADALHGAAKRWEKALDEIKDGEKDVREAADATVKASRQKTDGAAMISEGKALKSQAGDTSFLPSLLPASVAPAAVATPAPAAAPGP
jgi:hypothetical protein